jgi:enhancer of mRNA-decapping protein 4
MSSVIEEKIGTLLSVHLHAQSQIIRDVIKEVLKTNAEDNSILDAYKISLCQEVKDSVCDSVKDPVTKAFYKTMREVMIPAYEATTQKIFEQVASAVIESNANNIKDRRTQLQQQQDMALQISAMSENLTRMMQSMASLNEQVTQLRSQVAELSSNSASCAQDGPSSLTTAAVVDPLVHVKQEIKDSLSKGRYEAAFTKALSSNNAEITEYCCQQAEFSQLCARDTPVLSQLILLCVGQQLGSLLQSRKSSDLLEVISWLQDIAVILNPSDPTIERHVGTVIHQLMERIRSLLSAAGDPSLKRPLQTLLHILRGTRAG